jgi:hypothetical protein
LRAVDVKDEGNASDHSYAQTSSYPIKELSKPTFIFIDIGIVFRFPLYWGGT